jgi:hypothetical protein
MSLANGGMAAAVRGDVTDLSEVGARVLTDAALDRGRAVTVHVQSGYSFLFRAEARIVWRAVVESRSDSRVCAHGVFFSELSPFSRKLIRRLSGLVPDERSPRSPEVEETTWNAGALFDGDLEALFPASAGKEEAFDLLSDPDFERPLYVEEAELSGSLGYFTSADILQMLEATRATGVLHLEGGHEGQIHLRDGGVCGCFSKSLDAYEAAFRLLLADRGRFRFVPCPVRSNFMTSWTTTQLLLEAQIRLDHER